ncbi:MAG: response regulator transcription factor [Oscillospiraceae bacterium]|jgi:DNA-binding NarL/FixJ family response regulator|nr:response regulator transcription factor [Oscillospiraceae bacterium]
METDQIRVLIVDDDEGTVKRVMREIGDDARLSLAGVAHNGYEAVAAVAGAPPDVVVMDIEMESKLAGLFAAKEIVKMNPSVKVIIHTKHNTSYHVFKAFQFGVTDYIIKGVSMHDLIDTIMRAHQNKAFIHPQAAAYLRAEFMQLKNAQENLAYVMKAVLKLTASELEILKLLHSGMKQQEVAKVRFIEMTTMKTHVSNILKKFDRRSIAELLETIESTGFFSVIEEPL